MNAPAALRNLTLAALCLLGACTPARREVQGNIVRSIHFDGNGSFFSGNNDYQLQGAMEQDDSSFGIATFPLNYLARPAVLDRTVLARDAYRLETWYAEHGWFDARFEGWEVHQIRRQSFKRAGMVRVLGHVDPGRPSLIREFIIDGADSAATRVFTSSIQRTGSIQKGGQFDLETVEYTRDELLTLFRNNGYPYASVTTEVAAYPEDYVADVIFHVNAGIPARLGAIEVVGAEAVDPEVVLETLPFRQGDPYDAKKLRSGQQRLFALGTYAIVNIEPDLSDPELAEVPVTVRLTETRFQTVRLGGGAEYNAPQLTPRIAAQYRHVNLFERLLQFELGGTLGYRFAPGGEQIDDTPWNFDVKAGLSTPRLAGPRWGLSADVSVVQETLPNQYTYINPKASLRLIHRFTDAVSVDLGPTAQYYRIVSDDNGGLLARSLFGADFSGAYRLSTFDIGFTADWRDDPLNTTRGTYYRASARQAFPLLGSGTEGQTYVFTELGGEARTYRRVRTSGSPFTIALRARGRVMLSESKNEDGTSVSIPYPERIFQGGSADLRGFRLNQVGPYETVCTYSANPTPGRVANPFENTPNADSEVSRRHLPVGGEADALLSGEIRFPLPYGLSFVPFLDTGLLAPTVQEISPNQIRVAGGVGVRYNSVVGPIRVDLGFRPLYAEDRAASAVFGCEGLDAQPRGFDLLSGFGGQVGDSRTVPFAINLIVTIGHAF